MNAFLSLKQVQERNINGGFVPDWPDILQRQQALDSPVWVEEWLEAGPQPMSLETEELAVETWLEMAERQQPIDAPAWLAQWLDWSEIRARPLSLVKNEPQSLSAPIDRRVCQIKRQGLVVAGRSSAAGSNQQGQNDCEGNATRRRWKTASARAAQ